MLLTRIKPATTSHLEAFVSQHIGSLLDSIFEALGSHIGSHRQFFE